MRCIKYRNFDLCCLLCVSLTVATICYKNPVVFTFDILICGTQTANTLFWGHCTCIRKKCAIKLATFCKMSTVDSILSISVIGEHVKQRQSLAVTIGTTSWPRGNEIAVAGASWWAVSMGRRRTAMSLDNVCQNDRRTDTALQHLQTQQFQQQQQQWRETVALCSSSWWRAVHRYFVVVQLSSPESTIPRGIACLDWRTASTPSVAPRRQLHRHLTLGLNTWTSS